MKLGTTIEQLWLRALPTLTRDYLWVSIDGLRLYGTREHHVMLYWLLRGKYERHTRTLFEQSLRPGAVVLDIGAHIGYFTLLAARAVGPSGCVYAFEPDSSNYRFLGHNVALNGVEDVVTTVPKAVADTSGIREFFANTKSSVASSFWGSGRSVTATRVDCTTVDDFLGGGEIDVVKLDVEGAEIAALRGMRRTLTSGRRLVLFVECNPTGLASSGASAPELFDELASLELDVRVIDEKQRRLLPVTSELLNPDLADGKWYANLYCTRGGE